MTREQVVERISFGLHRLSARNGHTAFEDLCRAYAREELARNLLPATGPVGTGGDRGRDFESFHLYGDGDDGAFSCNGDGGVLVFACTTQQDRIPQKVRNDVARIMETGTAVAEICCLLTGVLSTGGRQRLIEELEGRHGVRLQVFDREALAEALAAPRLLWIAEEHLSIHGLHERAFGPLPVELGKAGDRDPAADRDVSREVLGALGAEPLRVHRDVDAELREALETALARPGPSLVTVEGEPQAGKTHTAVAALAAVAPDLPVRQARSSEELRTWLQIDHDAPSALLLDPADRIIGDNDLAGPFPTALPPGQDSAPPLPIVAVGSFGETARAFATPARRIEVDTALSGHELARARDALAAAGLLQDVERWGLGPAMAAGPRLTAAYRKARRRPGPCGDGARLVETMLGWRAAGLREELDEPTLRRLWEAIYPDAAGEHAWQAGIAWIATEVAPGQSPARLEADGWSPHPALLELGPARGWGEAWLSDRAWGEMRTWAGEDAGRLASLGTAARRLGAHDLARSTLERAIAAGSLRARFNLALTYAEGGESEADSARAILTSLRDELAGQAGPLDPGRLQLLAVTWYALGHLDQDRYTERAASAYREAATLGNLDAMVNLAQLERAAGRREPARSRLHRAAERGSAWAVTALVVDFDLDIEEALGEVDAAAADAIGRLMMGLDRKADARAAFARAAAAGRLSAAAQLGGLLLETGDQDVATKVLEKATDRGSRAGMLYLARALKKSDPRHSRRLMRTAHELGAPSAGSELLEMLVADGSEEAMSEAGLLRQELEGGDDPVSRDSERG